MNSLLLILLKKKTLFLSPQLRSNNDAYKHCVDMIFFLCKLDKFLNSLCSNIFLFKEEKSF